MERHKKSSFLGGVALFVAAATFLVVRRVRKQQDDAATTTDNKSTLPAWITAQHHAPPSFEDPRSAGAPPLDKAAILALRRAHFSAAQSVSYANRDPLLIVRGSGARLYDEAGGEYQIDSAAGGTPEQERWLNRMLAERQRAGRYHSTSRYDEEGNKVEDYWDRPRCQLESC